MTMLEEHEHDRPVHNFDGIIEDRVKSPPVYFAVLFYGLIIWAVIFCAYFLLSGWSSEADFEAEMESFRKQVDAQVSGEPQQRTPTAAAAPADGEAADVAAGKELYAANCAACHGAQGEGGIGPDLTSESYAYGRSEQDVQTSIREGRPGGMPAFGNQFSAEEIDQLADFVLSLGR